MKTLLRSLVLAGLASAAIGCSGSTTSASGSTGSTGRTTSTGTTGRATTSSTSSTSTSSTGGSSASSSTSGSGSGSTSAASGSSGSTSSTSTSTSSTSTSTSSTSTSSTSGSGSTGTTGSGSGSTGGGGCVNDSVAQARGEAAGTEVCLSDVTTLFSQKAGTPRDGGVGTAFTGSYYVADANGDAILIFKGSSAPVTGDPGRGDIISADALIQDYPDGGPTSTVELTGSFPSITISSSNNALPTPKTPTFAQLAHDGADDSMVGSWVLVPAASGTPYTEDASDPALQHVSGGNTFQNGFSLTDGTSTVWVDTFDQFSKPDAGLGKSCFPSDGGQPDFSQGGFRGVFDWGKAPNGTRAKLVYFGHCGDSAP